MADNDQPEWLAAARAEMREAVAGDIPAAVLGRLEEHVLKLSRAALVKHRPAEDHSMDERLQHLENLREAFMVEFLSQALKPSYRIAHGLLVELMSCAELNQDSLETATRGLLQRAKEALGKLPRPDEP